MDFALYHPQSNGQAERFVDNSKRVMLKSKDEGKSVGLINRFILVYHTTFHPTFEGKSPAEWLFGRNQHTVDTKE